MSVRAPDFETVYQAYYHSILAFLRAHIHQMEAAQDLTAAVFLAAYRNWEKFDPELGSVSTWLYCIARNRLKNYYRNQKNVISLDAMREDGEWDSVPDSEQFQRITEWRDALATALAALPERSRQVVVLRYYGGKSNREIAEILQITHENARVILTRSLQKLRENLSESGFTLGE